MHTEDEIREINPIDLLYQSKLSIVKFAAYMGVTERTIQYWLNGARNPSPQARRLAAELAEKWGVTTSESLSLERGHPSAS
jgi:DNA-binding transcriptional regulator YiaG